MKVKNKKRKRDNTRDKKPVGSAVQHFTATTREQFYYYLAVKGNVSYASRKIGITRRACYDERNRNAEFAQKWDDALQIAFDDMELAAHRRAVDGVDHPVYYQGDRVDTFKEYSDRLLMFLLKAARPDKFNDRLVHGVDSSIKELQQDRLVIEKALSDPELVRHLRNANDRVKQIECTVLEPTESTDTERNEDD
ncbi:hypothetical protein LCGC14_0391970 [marine sediment metagenome]|uniref:Terminase small subunit n=1 Tax=marine sediment metagenome TaxID=412755 RepID=A0A0F9W859_9ZZZZ